MKLTHLIEDHKSSSLPREVLEDLDVLEWEAPREIVTLVCGHRVPVKPGDTIWVGPLAAGRGRFQIYAVDPVTIQ